MFLQFTTKLNRKSTTNNKTRIDIQIKLYKTVAIRTDLRDCKTCIMISGTERSTKAPKEISDFNTRKK
jgi:hypothetical protein